MGIVAAENHLNFFFFLWFCFIDPQSISQVKYQTSSDKMSQLSQRADAVIALRGQGETMSVVPFTMLCLEAKALLVPVICSCALKSAY